LKSRLPLNGIQCAASDSASIRGCACSHDSFAFISDYPNVERRCRGAWMACIVAMSVVKMRPAAVGAGAVPGRSGFALTKEGEKVYAAAEQLLSATESFRGSLHEIHRGLGEELHVAMFEKTATNPNACIAEAVALFHQEAPEVSLHLHVGTIAMIERGVMSGQFQLGIVPEHRRSESLV
jgi:hypothetical protein